MKQYSSMLQYILFHAAPDRGRGAQFLPYLCEFLHWNSLEYGVRKLMEILMDSKWKSDAYSPGNHKMCLNNQNREEKPFVHCTVQTQ